jgi:hypothetical protein
MGEAGGPPASETGDGMTGQQDIVGADLDEDRTPGRPIEESDGQIVAAPRARRAGTFPWWEGPGSTWTRSVPASVHQ